MADARALAAALAAQQGRLYRQVRTRLLLNGEATVAAFNDAVYTFLKEEAQPEDVVVIYLAGHGVVFDRKYYFVTADQNPEKPYNGLNWEQFEQVIENDLDYVGKVVVINDTCKSGAMTRGGPLEEAELFRQLSEGFGVYHLSATTSSEDALDGVFTGVLTEGLGGKADLNGDRTIGLDELIQYVRAAVPKASGGRMHPQLKNVREGMDFPIAVVK